MSLFIQTAGDSSFQSGIRLEQTRSSTLVIITDAELALTGQSVGPVSAKLNICLRHVGMGQQQPGAKDWLGKNVKNGIGNDFSVNAGLAGTIGNTPDTIPQLAYACYRKENHLIWKDSDSHWISSP